MKTDHISHITDARYSNIKKQWILRAVVRKLSGHRVDLDEVEIVVDDQIINQAMKKAFFKGVEKGEDNSNKL